MVRKKFVSVFGLGFAGIIFTRLFPFKLLSRNSKNKNDFKVRSNPLAVKRQKIGEKNV